MHIRWFPFFLVCTLFIAGCSRNETNVADAELAPLPAQSQPSQLVLKPNSFLYFRSEDDPFTIRTNDFLHILSASGGVPTVVEAIDFTQVQVEAKKIGVFLPDTFVRLSSTGSVASILVHPSLAELQDFFQSSLLTP